jgi:hypothetical protein
VSTPQDVRDAHDMVQVAMGQIIEAWSLREDEGAAAEILMSALSELRCASCYIEPEKPNDSGVIPTARKTSDDTDEPSVGDVFEAEDPVALAKAMQRKRHGGAT